MTVRAVVFDLDGTLADTAGLVPSSGGVRRTPFDVLNLCPAGEPPAAVTISDQHRRLPGELIARGYRTAIITRSPGAYASTLRGLLQLDAERVMASGAASEAADKLRQLATGWGIPPDEIIYVGDTDDETVAVGGRRGFGARIQHHGDDPGHGRRRGEYSDEEPCTILGEDQPC